MPKLLRSSETTGCGATIELDNGDVVYVSIAQTGVLVRRWDLNGGLINPFEQLLWPEVVQRKQRLLPYPKEDILLAIEREILREPLDARVDWLAEINSIHHGWCFEFFATIKGHEVNLLQGLRFADTIDGLLSAFFASAILPAAGAHWQELYDRDYRMVETPNELNELIFSGTLNEADGDTQTILRTALGLRIQKVDGSKRCTCLCRSETEGLLNIEVTVSADGRAYEAVRTVLREPEGRTLY